MTTQEILQTAQGAKLPLALADADTKNAALEAMACGLPVVASREGGLPEFINSEVGTLVSPEDEDAFCAAILEELTRRHAEPERRDAIAHYARGNFAQAQFVARLEEVYQSAVRDFQIRGGQAV